MPDEAAAMTAVTDKEATDKRAVEEAATKRVVELRATEEATAKATTAEEVAGKTVDEATGAAGGLPALGQAPSVVGAKRAVAPSSSTSQTSLQGCMETLVCPAFSPLFFPVGLYSLITHFAQVLSLLRGHHDGHDCFYCRYHHRRCGCQGDSRAGSWW
jgi:hypothetical protein